jgi:hypothetical protein
LSRVHRLAFLVRRGTLEGFLLAVVGVLVLGSQPAAAQRTVFAPEAFVEEGRAGNVAYLGATTDQFKPDWTTRVGLSLAMRREGKGGQAGVLYGGYYEKYRTFWEFDHSEHTLGVDLSSAAGRRSSVGFSAYYRLGQAQGNPASPDPADRNLSQRTNRQALRATVRYDRRGSGRWSIGATGYGGRWWFHQIPGVPEVPETARVEDRNEYGATAALRYNVSPRFGLGWVYGFTRYDLATTGREDLQTLDMPFSIGIGKNARLAFQFGVFQRRVINAEGEAQPVEQGVTLQGNGGVSWTQTGRAVALTVNADRAASSGGSLMGTSTDTLLGVTVSNVRRIRWSWSATARFALRDPTRQDMKTVRTATGSFSVERRFRDVLWAHLSAGFAQQISGDTALQGSAPQGAIGLLWRPRGHDVGVPG